jgi:PAS domain S-box-containing protein
MNEAVVSSRVQQRTGEEASDWMGGPEGSLPRRAVIAAARRDLDAAQVLDALPTALYTTDPEGRVTYCNHAAIELAGRRPDIGRDRWCVAWRLFHPDGTPLPLDECPMAVALRQRRPIRGVEVLVERPDGGRAPIMPHPTPLFDEDGVFAGAVNVLVDITELKRAESAVSRRMEEQAALFLFTDRLYRAESLAEVHEAALDAITMGVRCERASILLLDDGGVMRFVAARGLSQAYRTAVEGHSPWHPGETDPQPIFVTDVEGAGFPEALEAVVRTEGIRALAFIPIVANGALIGKFMAYDAKPRTWTEGEAELSLTMARQLGFGIERRRAEEQRTLLIHELNHRVKNTLATVQSLALQTFRNTERSVEAREVFDARLAALSRAHDVLTAENWQTAQLREIVAGALEPFGHGDRLALAGPEARLTPKQALALSMALHELATNAVKYGALRGDAGRVRVDWSLAPADQPRELRIAWSEHEGPPVTAPCRRGFGSRMIERHLADELGGEVRLDYLPTGVVCAMTSPLAFAAPA